MNLLTASLVLVLSVVAEFGISAKPTKYTFQKVEDAGDKQVATVEFQLDEKNFTEENYGNLHRDILIALNRRKTKTAKIESQTKQHTTEQTTKTTVTTANTVQETTSTTGSTAKEELTSTTTTEPTTTTTMAAYPEPERKRRSLSDEIVYEDKDVFFFDLENNKIKNGTIRVPVGLHKEGYNISDDLLYDVLEEMNNATELGLSVSLQVVTIYRGFPIDATPSMLPLIVENRFSWIYIPIVVTLGFLLLILLFGTLFFVIFRSNARYVVQKYYRQVQGKSSNMNGTTKTTVESRPHPLSTPNGHLAATPHNNHPNEVHPVMLDDNCGGWLIPMSEFYAEDSNTREYV